MIYITPVDAPHLLWPVLEAAFQRVKDKTGEKWTPAYVMDRIISGQAGLFRLHDDGAHIAWVVVERHDQGEVWMNVWIVEGEGMDRFMEYLPLMDGLAKKIGAKSWRCTGRKGWGKYLKPIATVYERELL